MQAKYARIVAAARAQVAAGREQAECKCRMAMKHDRTLTAVSRGADARQPSDARVDFQTAFLH